MECKSAYSENILPQFFTHLTEIIIVYDFYKYPIRNCHYGIETNLNKHKHKSCFSSVSNLYYSMRPYTDVENVYSIFKAASPIINIK